MNKLKIKGFKLPFPIRVMEKSHNYSELMPIEAFDLGFLHRCQELGKDNKKANVVFKLPKDPCRAYRQGWREANEYFN